MKYGLLIISAIILILAGCSQSPNTVYVDKIVEVTKEIEIPVIERIYNNVEVEVEKYIYKYKELKHWDNLDELESWLKINKLPIVIIASNTGLVGFTNITQDARYDCDDYAIELQRKALEQGYIISLQLINNGFLNGVVVSPHKEPHMACLAIVEKSIYYIESIPPHKVVYITNLD